jgi:hypothetical protein
MNHKTQWILLGVALLTLSLVFSAVTARTQSLPPVTIEPSWLPAEQGGTISIYATDTLTFTEGYTARLLGYGVLQTTYINETTLQAVVPANVTPNIYNIWVLDQAGKEVGTGHDLTPLPPLPQRPNPPRSPSQPVHPNLRRHGTEAYLPYAITASPCRSNGGTFVVSIEVYNNEGAAETPWPSSRWTFSRSERLATCSGNPINGIRRHTANAGSQSAQMASRDQVNISANDWAEPLRIPADRLRRGHRATDGSKTATGKPKIIIEASKPTRCGCTGAVHPTLTLANRGSRTAINIIRERRRHARCTASGAVHRHGRPAHR